jgi:alpha,alpha-trehalase
MEVALLAVDHEMLRVSIRPFTALPVTIAYRGHFREISPGQSYEFRLIKPRGERSSCAPAQVDTGTKG